MESPKRVFPRIHIYMYEYKILSGHLLLEEFANCFESCMECSYASACAILVLIRRVVLELSSIFEKFCCPNNSLLACCPISPPIVFHPCNVSHPCPFQPPNCFNYVMYPTHVHLSLLIVSTTSLLVFNLSLILVSGILSFNLIFSIFSLT